MMPLPWKRIRPLEEATVGSVTELRLRRWRDIPRLTFDALRLRRAVQIEPGVVAVCLAAAPLRRTFWTLTLWADEPALDAYVRTAAHADAMRRFRGRLERSRSARWKGEFGSLPRWAEAVARLAAER